MRILVVEDESKIANSIRLGLEQENYSVDIAREGSVGLDLAVSEEYDLIVMDRMLPGIDGVEIVKKVRAAKINTPILFLTAKGQIEDRVEGLDAGADDYLLKPFAFSELLARIKALTRRPKANIVSLLSVSDLTLNPSTFEVKRGGILKQLSRKEFSLLEYLMRHPGRVVTKDQIINHVWNYDSDVLPNSVEVYIKHLRDKICEPNIIHTIRGFGYKIGE